MVHFLCCVWTVVFFFFSSRRRHTRCSRDWSSDVCSSDLIRPCSSAAACRGTWPWRSSVACRSCTAPSRSDTRPRESRSEEHTSELQSRLHLVCRLLLEKKKKSQSRHVDGERVGWDVLIAGY